LLNDTEDDISIFEALIAFDELSYENIEKGLRNQRILVKLLQMGYLRTFENIFKKMKEGIPDEYRDVPDAIELRQNIEKYSMFLIQLMKTFNSLKT
jgi:hypothetical protein